MKPKVSIKKTHRIGPHYYTDEAVMCLDCGKMVTLYSDFGENRHMTTTWIDKNDECKGEIK